MKRRSQRGGGTGSIDAEVAVLIEQIYEKLQTLNHKVDGLRHAGVDDSPLTRHVRRFMPFYAPPTAWIVMLVGVSDGAQRRTRARKARAGRPSGNRTQTPRRPRGASRPKLRNSRDRP